MFCKHCGTELDENGLCPKCGIVYENTYPKYTEPKTSGMAVTGFVMSILAMFVEGEIYIILFFLSVVFSFVGISHTRNGAMRGRGFAITGLIIDLIPFTMGFIDGCLSYVH